MEADDSDSRALLKRVGSAIAVARKRAGFTQAVVANKIGLEKETVSRLETGAIAPTIYRLSQFADLFDCPIGSLFGEHRAAALEDARALSALIADLPRDDRQMILRLVSDVASVVRERDAARYRSLARERKELLEATGAAGRKKRQPKQL